MRCGKRSRKGWVILLMAGALALFMTLARREQDGKPEEPSLVVVALDESGSMNRAERRLACRVLNAVIDRALRRREAIFFAYGARGSLRKLMVVRPATSADLVPFEEQYVDAAEAATGRGTSMSEALTALYEVARSRADRIYAILLTDGEDDDRARSQRVAQGIASLSKCRGILVAPVHDEFRTEVEQVLAAFGRQCVTSGELDAAYAIEVFCGLVKRDIEEAGSDDKNQTQSEQK